MVYTMPQPPHGLPARDGAPSKVESIKRESRQLRGTIAETLRDGSTAKFEETDVQLLKTHGIYQQYDRDSATELKSSGQDKEHQFMARVRIPGGRLSAGHSQGLDALADRFANRTQTVPARQADHEETRAGNRE